MARLIYFATASLNGCITDSEGKFGWAEPSEEVHAFVNDLIRNVGTHLYGRRMYETMKVWETDPSIAEASPVMRDFAGIWKGADKIVYSRTLSTVETKRTRLENNFDPQVVSRLLASSTRDVIIGGPSLASHAFRAGLVDECHVVVVPIIVRAGSRFLPDDVLLPLELVTTRAFGSGMVYLHYKSERNAS